MERAAARSARGLTVWFVVGALITVPIVAAAASPLLAYRRAAYIVAGLAGVVALVLVFVQPLLMSGTLPGLPASRSRRLHRYTGVGLVAAVVVHVGGLWLTSAPDVIDALTFTSPTPFSPWGVVAMWAVFASALLVALRRRLALRPKVWRALHALFAVVIVTGGVVHSLLIEGTMETWSKAALCAAVVVAALVALSRIVARNG